MMNASTTSVSANSTPHLRVRSILDEEVRIDLTGVGRRAYIYWFIAEERSDRWLAVGRTTSPEASEGTQSVAHLSREAIANRCTLAGVPWTTIEAGAQTTAELQWKMLQAMRPEFLEVAEGDAALACSLADSLVEDAVLGLPTVLWEV